MSNPGDADNRPIGSVRDLAAYLASGCKPRASFRIGTEHEAFGFTRPDCRPPAYEGPAGIQALLGRMREETGAEPILDGENVIGLKWRGASISLEPGGQFELSGAPLETLHQTKAELDAHIARLHKLAPALGLGFAPLGFHPQATRADMPMMPKGRYQLMRAYMPTVGSRGLDMMFRTCTVQANLDFASEADMVKKLRVASTFQPLATALFANSPFYEGKPNGYLSNRALAWTDTDNARSGIPAVIFEDGFGFERYAEWLLDVPMYFVYRDGHYIDALGKSFRDFMAGRLEALPGARATVGDFADHATTAFPDVRLKTYLETRGADAGSPAMMLAQSALWTGLLYDETALNAAYELSRTIPYPTLLGLRAEVPRTGINTPLGAQTLRALAAEVVAIAQAGLRARDRQDEQGRDEQSYLDPLAEIAAGAPTQAEHWLALYHGAWQGEVRHIFEAGAL
ncbi:glutamate--cysteine ligase [Acidocella sp.]|uniref:glutamate--cysteine ligase n=1 Tax=Acidocella sp. TaxID=50710 RepID=UPI0026370F6E|nr:glutamate--cysteine ligase [Acidocella sp.]